MTSGAGHTTAASADPAARRPRDLRLDFFRGMAMFIILLAHTPGNTWTLWIPARFGFSDATEIFVFCSGMASALAFGSVFATRSWWMGSARIAFRVWQVYWAHIGVFLVTAIMLFAIDHFGVGLEGKRYITGPYVVPLFTQTGEALIGLLTLTWVPGLFDILPMYLVVLGMIPIVMALYKFAGRWAVFLFIAVVWAASNLAGYARTMEPEGAAQWQLAIAAFGENFTWMNLPSNPFGDHTWFFNPFAWQLIFFTGFCFGMKWLPAPPIRRWMVLTALTYVVVVVPFAWFKIHQGFYLPQEWALTAWITETRAAIGPAWWKTWIGGARYLHFLAVAYLAWAAVGPNGIRLNDGFRALGAAPKWVLLAAGAFLIVSIPYTYVDEIKLLSPALDGWFFANIPLIDGGRIGLIQLIHLAALVLVAWAAIGARGRQWLVRDLFLMAVPIIRKVGTQSLAVFMVSIVLARFNGWVLDMIGRDVWTRAAVNLTGFAILIATAYTVSWFKSQPWRTRPTPAATSTQTSTETERAKPAGGADARGGRQIAAIRA